MENKESIIRDILWTIAKKDILPENPSYELDSSEGMIEFLNFQKEYIKTNHLLLTNHNHRKDNDDYSMTFFIIENKHRLYEEILLMIKDVVKGMIKFKIEKLVIPHTLVFYSDSDDAKLQMIDYGRGTIVV